MRRIAVMTDDTRVLSAALNANENLCVHIKGFVGCDNELLQSQLATTLIAAQLGRWRNEGAHVISFRVKANRRLTRRDLRRRIRPRRFVLLDLLGQLGQGERMTSQPSLQVRIGFLLCNPPKQSSFATQFGR